MSSPVEILYEQGPCLVVNKPPGLLTQAPPGIDSLEVRIKAFLKEREAKPGGVYLGVPHRLDRPASGAMVFAKHVRAARRLAEQFEARTVRKLYWACVEGAVDPEAGTWTDFLRKVPDQPRAEVVPSDHPEGREAILHYRTLVRFQCSPHAPREENRHAERDDYTWLEIELETGRMHQVRVQAAARNRPVLGDALYGSQRAFGEQHADPRLRAIALHARQLAFAHPMTHEPVSVIAPQPLAWEKLGLK